jgi:hypothetical protein
MAFDGREEYLFGTPTYQIYDSDFVARLDSIFPFLGDLGGEFPTLKLTYERFSGYVDMFTRWDSISVFCDVWCIYTGI